MNDVLGVLVIMVVYFGGGVFSLFVVVESFLILFTHRKNQHRCNQLLEHLCASLTGGVPPPPGAKAIKNPLLAKALEAARAKKAR